MSDLVEKKLNLIIPLTTIYIQEKQEKLVESLVKNKKSNEKLESMEYGRCDNLRSLAGIERIARNNKQLAEEFGVS